MELIMEMLKTMQEKADADRKTNQELMKEIMACCDYVSNLVFWLPVEVARQRVLL
jgi:hypothetical protein